MDAAELARIVGTLLAFVGIGWLLRTTGVLTAEDARPIHAVIVYVGLPAFIFQAVHPARLEAELAVIVLVAWVVFAVTAAVAWFCARLLRLPEPVAGAFILASSLGNTGYIGYPVAKAFLGEDGLVRAIFYDAFGTVGALLTVGLLVAARFGSREGRGVSPVREIVRFPGVIALVVALLARPVAIPETVSAGLDALATLVVPLIMLSVGLMFEVRKVANRLVALGALSVIRLGLAPVIGLLVGGAVLGDPEAVRLVVLQAGMPAMMLSIVIGGRFGLDTEFLASAVVFTTAASIITIPLMQLAVG